jgi:hypothetical protein
MANRMIIDTYFEPNKTLQELCEIPRSGYIDLLRQFCEACRDDLRNFRSIWATKVKRCSVEWPAPNRTDSLSSLESRVAQLAEA